jgi:hypothetical protein
VTLPDGGEVRLEDAQDVSDRNDDVLVLPLEGEDSTFTPWRRVRRFELQW